ncbi:hypothetical protein QBC34DRAFT_488186 [Podospora aff. communis PSN243]|uniref:Uncharacterized protein n=1 Tax=Podospora aff. communis PSN243 TaxID=3040156 RepID=A0AAV9G8J0_9PEZI|nr:hypothetical protein QBC34DRAFT_488186 [Podospora aff. communis PSN243]
MTQVMTTLPKKCLPNNICGGVLTATQVALAASFWADDPSRFSPTSLEAYGHYYTEQCRTFYRSLRATLPVTEHQDIMDIAQRVKTLGATRQELIQFLEGKYPDLQTPAGIPKTDIINATADLVTRLLLMVDVGTATIAPNRISTGRAFRCWTEGTIRNFTACAFPVQRSNRHDGIQLTTDFNARNLDLIGGFRVEPTNNLLDHLDVVDIAGQTIVMIFHHASFLKDQQHGNFPDGLVHETLQTMALLFPQGRYHKERLYDQAKPRTLRQWWNDRREGSQWYALWVAVGFTVFFGLVQSIEGALQAYKSYHPTGEGS